LLVTLRICLSFCVVKLHRTLALNSKSPFRQLQLKERLLTLQSSVPAPKTPAEAVSVCRLLYLIFAIAELAL